MVRTKSATPLDAVQVERRGLVNDVWLRTDIEQIEEEIGEGLSQTMWEAFEVYGTVPASVTAEEIEDDFDDWWARFEDEAMTDAEKLADARDMAQVNGDAIEELAELVAEGEVTMEDLAQAIVELAEIVGGGE
jgi:hypothetical protein